MARGDGRRCQRSHTAISSTVSEMAIESDKIAVSQFVIWVVSPTARIAPIETSRTRRSSSIAATANARTIQANVLISACSTTRQPSEGMSQ